MPPLPLCSMLCVERAIRNGCPNRFSWWEMSHTKTRAAQGEESRHPIAYPGVLCVVSQILRECRFTTCLRRGRRWNIAKIVGKNVEILLGNTATESAFKKE